MRLATHSLPTVNAMPFRTTRNRSAPVALLLHPVSLSLLAKRKSKHLFPYFDRSHLLGIEPTTMSTMPSIPEGMAVRQS
jgi:hypothetical protein